MTTRREKRRQWVRRGDLAVEFEVEVVFPKGLPNEACLEPQVVKWLDEVARRADAGDVEFLQTIGKVYRALPTTG